MICWVCKKMIKGKLILLTQHMLTHKKSELINVMVMMRYSRGSIGKLDYTKVKPK